MNHLLQLRAGDFAFLRIRLFVNEPHLLHAVAGAEQQQAFARQTVAAGAAGFLIITFDVFRQIVVDHETHVRFVDAHAEGDGGANHARLVAEKCFLIFRPVARGPCPRDTAAPSRRRRKVWPPWCPPFCAPGRK